MGSQAQSAEARKAGGEEGAAIGEKPERARERVAPLSALPPPNTHSAANQLPH